MSCSTLWLIWYWHWTCHCRFHHSACNFGIKLSGAWQSENAYAGKSVLYAVNCFCIDSLSVCVCGINCRFYAFCRPAQWHQEDIYIRYFMKKGRSVDSEGGLFWRVVLVVEMIACIYPRWQNQHLSLTYAYKLSLHSLQWFSRVLSEPLLEKETKRGRPIAETVMS